MHELPKCAWNWKPPLPTFSFRQVNVEGPCWEVTSSPVCTHWSLPSWCISLHWSVPHWSQDRVWVFSPLPTAALLLKLFLPNTVTIVSLKYRIIQVLFWFSGTSLMSLFMSQTIQGAGRRTCLWKNLKEKVRLQLKSHSWWITEILQWSRKY